MSSFQSPFAGSSRSFQSAVLPGHPRNGSGRGRYLRASTAELDAICAYHSSPQSLLSSACGCPALCPPQTAWSGLRGPVLLGRASNRQEEARAGGPARISVASFCCNHFFLFQQPISSHGLCRSRLPGRFPITPEQIASHCGCVLMLDQLHWWN